MKKKDKAWDFESYLADMERHRQKTDGAYELALDRLRRKGGPEWYGSISQIDVVATCIEAAREHDAAKRRKS